MKHWKKVLAWTVGLFVLAFALPIAVLYVAGLAVGMCANHEYASIMSPAGNYKAVIFQRDCGATTGFSTQISILSAGESLGNSKGNVYIIDGHPESASPKVGWESENQLTIYRPLNGSEYKAKSEFGWFKKVSIKYGAGSS